MPKCFFVEADWHWLAGIWEGEGTAGLRWAKARHEGSTRRAFLYIAISQRETSMLREVERIVGYGKIYPANRKDQKPMYFWQCACAQARRFMIDLLPFVRSDHKKAQLTQALALDEEMRTEGAKRVNEARTKRWRQRAEVSGTKIEAGIRS